MKESLFPQISLPLSNATGVDDIPDAVLGNKPTLHAAIILGIEVSGLQDDQIASFMGITPGNFSKYRSGKYNWPTNDLPSLCEFLGNKIPLRWWALRTGDELVPRKSTLEQQLEEARAALAEERRRNETILEFVRQTK